MNIENNHKVPSLFEVYGIELEYMLVDQKTLNVVSQSELILKTVEGEILNEMNFLMGNQNLSISNELVSHVLEFKNPKPSKNLLNLNLPFHQLIQLVNKKLSGENICLLPTSMHPWMNPKIETKIWSHQQNEIYLKYHQLFNCYQHGWANLQSTHLNLPFSNDDELFELHESVRLLLPLMPTLTYSSPIYECQIGPMLSTRLWFYQDNQKKIPSIIGDLVPDSVRNKKEYDTKILNIIDQDLKQIDPEGILESEWVNSRGAICKFSRDSLEIRILDIQECPQMDLAISYVICETLKFFCSAIKQGFRGKDNFVPLSSEFLKKILLNPHQKSGPESFEVLVSYFQNQLGLGSQLKGVETLKDFWHWALERIEDSSENAWAKENFRNILMKGNLSERILNSLNSLDKSTHSHQQRPQNLQKTYKIDQLREIYIQLAHSLEKNQPFWGV
jgi:hypothetical protein